MSAKLPKAIWLSDLSERQAEVAIAIRDDMQAAQIAHRLGLTESTVRSYTRNIMRRTGLHSNGAVALWVDRQQRTVPIPAREGIAPLRNEADTTDMTICKLTCHECEFTVIGDLNVPYDRAVRAHPHNMTSRFLVEDATEELIDMEIGG